MVIRQGFALRAAAERIRKLSSALVRFAATTMIWTVIGATAPLAAQQTPATNGNTSPAASANPTPTSNADARPEAIQQSQPSFYVAVDCNHQTRTYREGDHLTLTVNSEVDAFVYVLYRQADGKLFQIFPNGDQRDNRLLARQPVRIPASDDSFRWQIGPPFGQETVKVLASKEPIQALAHVAARDKLFAPVATEQAKGVALELGPERIAPWSEAELKITTIPRDQAASATGAKRHGVFFGVSTYEFYAEEEEVNGRSPNLPPCHRDARRLAEVLREVGELSNARIYTNEHATRKNVEEAMTRWLPSVSRPGDTVFFYFSGHGGQIPDDQRDEVDGKDEYLVTYDHLSLSALVALKKRADQNKLEPYLRPRLEGALALLRQASSVEKGGAAITRATSVTDDLFGHWLQHLAGRQVVVVLDICHAGGFAAQEKDVLADTRVRPFDFVESELGRLKDIGQGETSLLAACGAQELSQLREEGDLSVMTHFLVEAVLRTPGAMTIQQAHQQCEVGMRDYFEALNRQRATAGRRALDSHHATLSVNGMRPVLIKP